MQYLADEFGDHIADLPLFPDDLGRTMTKAAVIDLWRMIGEKAGLTIERENRKVTGHTARSQGRSSQHRSDWHFT